MTALFNLVQSVSNWEQHDQGRETRLAQLQQGEARAAQRKLEQSAERFQASPDLLNAINAALVTRTPLLLTGEPGTGKTQVAYFLARYFKIKLFKYQVHSGSQAQDMRYDFDAVAYLRDAYLAQQTGDEGLLQSNVPDEYDPRTNPKYLKKKALWQAYEYSQPSVLLLDEVDKAPRDFPNDLLQELDQNRFAHPFNQGEDIENQGALPILILTSNGERRLPDAFLRRCMVHHMKLDQTLLESILGAWEHQFVHQNDPEQQAALQQSALSLFQEIRGLPLNKKPGTAELLLWVSVLSAQGNTADDLSYYLPALSALIKDPDDHAQVKDYFQKKQQ